MSYYRFTALHYSSKHGHSDTAEYLLNMGAYVDATTKMGITPLIMAAQYGQLGIAQLLVDHKANIEEKSVSGCVSFLYTIWSYDVFSSVLNVV